MMHSGRLFASLLLRDEMIAAIYISQSTTLSTPKNPSLHGIIMSVMTMTLHQAQLLSRHEFSSDTLPIYAYDASPQFHHGIGPGRGTKRSRGEDDTSLSRTQKRSMSASPSEVIRVQESTMMKLINAQRQRHAHPEPPPPSPSPLPIMCVDCGASSLRNIKVEECQACGCGLCRNCSLTTYRDNGDFQVCLECSRT